MSPYLTHNLARSQSVTHAIDRMSWILGRDELSLQQSGSRPVRSRSVTEALDRVHVALQTRASTGRCRHHETTHSQSLIDAIDRIRQDLEASKHDLEKNKSLVRSFFKAIDAGDGATLDRYVAVGYIDHNPQFPDLKPGLAGLRDGYTRALKAWRDFHHVIVDQVAEGDKVVTQIEAYATHVGEFLGVPATGKKITMSGVAIHRVAGGKLVEHWANIDQVSVLIQLGVLPGPESEAQVASGCPFSSEH